MSSNSVMDVVPKKLNPLAVFTPNRIKKTKKPKKDKNKKRKKQPHDRKVSDIKSTFQTDHIMEQISQICYLGKVYCLFWDYTNKALMSITDININIHNVIHDNVYYVAYDDMIILDIIYKHFGAINIYSEYPGSYEGLYTLVSSLPLTQYTVTNE